MRLAKTNALRRVAASIAVACSFLVGMVGVAVSTAPPASAAKGYFCPWGYGSSCCTMNSWISGI